MMVFNASGTRYGVASMHMARAFTAALFALFVIAIVFVFFVRKKKVKSPEFGTTDEFVQWMATEAVKDATDNNHITLNYSPDSIQSVEKILGSLHDQYVKNPSSVSANGLGSAYGAYLGEVIRRTEPGAKWERDDPVGGEKSYPIIWGAGNSYPMAWCYHRIVNGPEDNVWVKYRVLKDKRGNSESHKPE
ncbi:MAG: hypothetical protein WBL63_05085 [Candidatus Acidiferrum sp.]